MRIRLTAACLLLTVGVAVVCGQTSEQAKRQTASAFVVEKLALWQKRLNLQEWTVSVVSARRIDMKQGTTGKIRWDKGKKTATIWALDPVDYPVSTEEMLRDLEFTVVHELIHLELASLPRSQASRRSEEFAVNQLTEALLALDRRQ